MSQIKPIILCIMDGWGLSAETDHNAVACAHTPVYDQLLQRFPHSRLEASEQAVGLPEGQPGNSEVGHMTIGSGRVILTDLPRITAACENGQLAEMDQLLDFARHLQKTGGRAHLIGLASRGGVHSHSDHILALAQILTQHDVEVCLHIITDGRDTLPKDADGFLPDFLDSLPDGCTPATLCGRYYAMDRDNRWERTQKFLDLVAAGTADHHAPSALIGLLAGYERGQTDEFIAPTCLSSFSGMDEKDGLVIANFRVDRVRQILRAFYQPEQTGCSDDRLCFGLPFSGPCISLTPVSDDLKDQVKFIFGPAELKDGLAETVEKAGLKQIRLAETEKYPHVTFFFNGGRDVTYPHEERRLVASPNVATYDLQPEMSALDVCAHAVRSIKDRQHHLIIINFANPDMVGHTGDLQATIKAVETVDSAVGQLVEAVLTAQGAMIVTADHGNCETLWDTQAGQPHTAHTTNLVPCILVSDQDSYKSVCLADGSLADLAPTLLELLGMQKPDAMTGHSLIIQEVAHK